MKKITFGILLCFTLIFLASCSLRKHIPDDKMILKNNVVEIHSEDVDFTKSNISAYISQSKNPNILGFMPLTWLYYKTDDETRNNRFLNWVNRTISKKPVYFNNDLKEKSVSQIRKYLNDIGYFNSGISTQVKNNRGIVSVIYGIYPAKPYIIDRITYEISDTSISKYVKEIENDVPVKKGNIFNVFDLDDERDKISEHLKNNGYYY